MSAVVFGCSDRRVGGTCTMYISVCESWRDPYTVVHERPKTSVEVWKSLIKIPDPRPLTCPSTAYSKSHVWFVLEKMLQYGQSPPAPPPPSYIPETHEYLTVKKNRSRTVELRLTHGRPQRVLQRCTGKVVAAFPTLGGGSFILSAHCGVHSHKYRTAHSSQPSSPLPASASQLLNRKYEISFRLVL